MSPAAVAVDTAAPPPPPPANTTTTPPDGPVEILARTIWGEARGEPLLGQEAIAAVVMNRVARSAAKKGGYWWGNTVEQVCLRPGQFSCWNVGDPNRAKLLAVTPGNKVFRQCLDIARRAVDRQLTDPTNGATHYHTKEILPPWARGRTPSAAIGDHLFYNDVE